MESTKASWSALLEELALLKELGYQKFKIINQANVTKQVCPSPATQGKYIRHQFEYGASGLFGEETPGNWLSENETIKAYKRIFLNYKIFGINGIIAQISVGKKLLDMLKIKEPWYDTHVSQ